MKYIIIITISLVLASCVKPYARVYYKEKNSKKVNIDSLQFVCRSEIDSITDKEVGKFNIRTNNKIKAQDYIINKLKSMVANRGGNKIVVDTLTNKLFNRGMYASGKIYYGELKVNKKLVRLVVPRNKFLNPEGSFDLTYNNNDYNLESEKVHVFDYNMAKQTNIRVEDKLLDLTNLDSTKKMIFLLTTIQDKGISIPISSGVSMSIAGPSKLNYLRILELSFWGNYCEFEKVLYNFA